MSKSRGELTCPTGDRHDALIVSASPVACDVSLTVPVSDPARGISDVNSRTSTGTGTGTEAQQDGRRERDPELTADSPVPRSDLNGAGMATIDPQAAVLLRDSMIASERRS